MASTTMPASEGSLGHHPNHHGYSQSRSHHRKAAPDRIPVVPDARMPTYSLASPFDPTQDTSSNAVGQGLHRQHKSVGQQNGYPQASQSQAIGTKSPAMATSLASQWDPPDTLRYSRSDFHAFPNSQGDSVLRAGARSYNTTPLLALNFPPELC